VPDEDGNLTEAEKEAMRQAQEDLKEELRKIQEQADKN
jgi:hypothetical protein